MKINNPRLFNGQLLASYEQIAGYLSGSLGSFGFTEDVGFTGKIDSTFIPISGISATSGYYNIFADTIKMSSANSQTISEKFTEIQGKIDAVKQYKVEATSGLTVTSVSATTDGITTDTFTVSIDATAFQIKQQKTTTDGFASTYALIGPSGAVAGDLINIPKDQFLKNAAYIPSAEVLRLEFELNVEGGSSNTVDIPVSSLVDEYSAGAGINIADNIDGENIISVKKSNADYSEYFFFVDPETGVGVSGIQAAIGAKAQETLAAVSGKYSQIVHCVTIPEKEQLATTPVYDVDTLLVTDDGETAIVVVGEQGQNELIKISKEVATESADIENAENAENADHVATAGAVKAYVGAIKTATDASIATLSGNLTNTRERAVEFLEAQNVQIGTNTPATVSGRVIAVYDSTGEQCYPTITWNKTDKISTLNIDAAVDTYDIIYSKVIETTAVVSEPSQEG